VDCDRCGGLLRDALTVPDRVVTEGLGTGSAEWQAAMAKHWSREARAGSPRYWLGAAAASFARRWMQPRPETRARVVRAQSAEADSDSGPDS
jgi:hypothetical protein